MKASTRIVSLMLAIFIFTGIFATSASAASTDLKNGIGFVTASALRLRSGPSSSTATLDYASNGEVVVILEKSGAWYKVIYDLKVGYMHSDYLSVSAKQNAELGYGKIVGTVVNIRSGPGTSYSDVGDLLKNEKVTITETQQGSDGYLWGKIGTDKWVAMNYIKTN